MEKVAIPLAQDVHGKYIHLFLVVLLISLVFAVYVLVYETGGIKYVYSHSMYLPILFAGYLYGVYGGAMIGVLGGVLLGPFMPIDTSTFEQQETINWLYRGIFFVAIGLLAGAGSSALRDRIKNIQFLAHNDRETGLPNRTSTIEYLSRLLHEEADSANTSHVLMKLACDNLMEIEVTFGFDASASVMRQVLQRLRESLPKGVFLSKTHHSEFAIVLHGMSMPEAAELARQLHGVMKRAFDYEGIPLHVETVMGYLPLPDTYQSADSVLQKAELAVMGARGSHQRVAVYDARSEMQRQDNLALLGQLRGALGKGDLQLYYQPKICLATQNMVGAEALMRWPHAERGMIPPDQFIPQAEQSSIINELTAWALHSALAQHVLWDAAGKHHDLKVAVNVSIHDLLAPDFSDTVIDALQTHAVDAKHLELELTESTLMEDIRACSH